MRPVFRGILFACALPAVLVTASLLALSQWKARRLAAGGPPHGTDRRPARLPGLAWIYEETPEGTRIRLDGDVAYRDPRPLPLRFVVRRPSP